MWKLLPAVPDLQPASERRREVRHYATRIECKRGQNYGIRIATEAEIAVCSEP